MGDLHFLNWVRLVVFTFDRISRFTIYELRFTNEDLRAIPLRQGFGGQPFAVFPRLPLPTIGSSITLVGSDADHRLTLDSFIQKSIDPIIQYLSVKYLCNTLDFNRG
jgi:hypothetical protein